MQLNKTQALFLSKILFNYKNSYHELSRPIEGELDSIISKLEIFLTGETQAPELDEDEDEDEDDDDDDEDEDEPEPQAGGEVKSIDLHDFSPPLQISTGELEFELEDGVVDVLVNGYAEVTEVSYVVRNNNSIKIWENGLWHTWQVVKTPKIWKKLKNDVVYKVVQ